MISREKKECVITRNSLRRQGMLQGKQTRYSTVSGKKSIFFVRKPFHLISNTHWLIQPNTPYREPYRKCKNLIISQREMDVLGVLGRSIYVVPDPPLAGLVSHTLLTQGN
jgi:hypothetical protein